jgi:hypothetical protein
LLRREINTKEKREKDKTRMRESFKLKMAGESEQ